MRADLLAAIDHANLTDDEYLVLIEAVKALKDTRYVTRGQWSNLRMIALFRARAPRPVSDSELQLAIAYDPATGGSRHSVANRIRALRKDGYQILRELNYGYRMEAEDASSSKG
jgi:biotin operon repressor